MWILWFYGKYFNMSMVLQLLVFAVSLSIFLTCLIFVIKEKIKGVNLIYLN